MGCSFRTNSGLRTTTTARMQKRTLYHEASCFQSLGATAAITGIQQAVTNHDGPTYCGSGQLFRHLLSILAADRQAVIIDED